MTLQSSADWANARGEKWRAQLHAMEGMLAPVDAPLLTALNIDGAPHRIADVGCGGGGATLAIVSRAFEGSVVHGLDISPTLIEAARGRGSSAEFHVADVANAAPPVTLYDRLASRFGIMFFEDPMAAFANLSHWLAPGGRFAFAVWGSPSANPWMKIVKDTVAEVIELPPTDPNAPGPFRYADVSKLEALLQASGFREVDVQEWRGKLPIGGGLPAEQATDFALESFSSLGDWLKTAADREALTKARRTLLERFSACLDLGVVRMDAAVHIVTGFRSE